MLHSIREVCELTDKSRSSIYRMFSRGDLAYIVGKDGKRRVETSELLRVFDEINFNDSPNLSDSMEAKVAPPTAQGGDPYVTARELNDLRGMMHDMKSELDDIREDNRRLLRLLEHQTMQPQSPHQPTPQPVHYPTPPPSTVADSAEAGSDVGDDDDDEELPVTAVAEQGWKAYRKQRAVQEEQRHQMVSASAYREGTAPHVVNELGTWLKNFFFGEWQKR
ncbi:MAG: helix-turn-helix domain-containing protein [Gammaproteobacteria bacterium]|jgi:hypothetical protein|nr:helix-turn-helix domain-containing protein [Gammaproteobacteria bacterium]